MSLLSPHPQQEGRSDIPLAAGLSLLAVAGFLCLLVPVLFFEEWCSRMSPARCSISGCHVMEGGRFAAVTYWTAPRRSSDAPDYFMATLDLQGSDLQSCEEQRCPQICLAATAFPGRQLLAIDGGGKVTRRRLIQRQRGSVLPALFGPGVPTRLQSVDDRLVVAQTGSELLVCDLEREKTLWSLTNVEVACFVPVSSRRSLCISLEDERLLELDARTGREVRTPTRLPSAACGLAISGDGRRLAIRLQAAGVRILGLPTETGPWTDLNPDRPGFESAGQLLALSPSGEVLVTSPDRNPARLTIWSVSTGRRLQHLECADKAFQGIVFANEHTLISWNVGGTLHRWDFRRGTSDVWTPPQPCGSSGTWRLPLARAI